MTKQFGTPGPRAIYPEMCDSPSLGRCGILANALFPRLVAQADDQGRLAGDAYSILIACMGRLLRLVTVDELEAALAELEGAEVVQRYEVRGEQYLQLLQWWRWQGGQRRAYPSRWPSPPGWRDLTYGSVKGEAETFEQAVSQSSPRNAAIRRVLPRNAASRAAPRAAPRTGPGARAMPDRAMPNTVPSPATPGGANGAPPGGLTKRAQEVLGDPHASEEAKDGARAMLALAGRQ
jgi:hypothetical protein